MNNGKFDDNSLLSTISRTAQLIEDSHQQQMDTPKDAVLGALCALALFHLGSTKAAKMMYSDPKVGDQSPDDLANLLIAAAFLGNVELVNSLLREGADANSKSAYLGAPLQAAATKGHYEVVVLLLKHGVDPNRVGWLQMLDE